MVSFGDDLSEADEEQESAVTPSAEPKAMFCPARSMISLCVRPIDPSNGDNKVVPSVTEAIGEAVRSQRAFTRTARHVLRMMKADSGSGGSFAVADALG